MAELFDILAARGLSAADFEALANPGYRGETGIYVGNDPANLTAYEEWFGKSTGSVQLHGGRANLSDMGSSVGYVGGQYPQSTFNGTLRWTIPWMHAGAVGDFTAVTDGDYDTELTQQANAMLSREPGVHKINVRGFWEFNGSWQPWAAAGNEAAFVAAWKHVVDLYRGISNRFRFDWCANIGQEGTMSQAAVESCYPGDAYVDVITIDHYWYVNTSNLFESDPRDPVAAFEYMRDRPMGFAWLEGFANKHNKPFGFGEWGVRLAGFGPYIELVHDWMAGRPGFEYHVYWNDDGDYPGKLSGGRYMLAGKAFVEKFGILPAAPTNVEDIYPEYDFAYDPTNSFYKINGVTTDDMAVFYEQFGAKYSSNPAGASGSFGWVPDAFQLLTAQLEPSAEWSVYAEAEVDEQNGSDYQSLVALSSGVDDRDSVHVNRNAFTNDIRGNVRRNDLPLGTDTNFGSFIDGQIKRYAFVLDGAGVRFFSDGAMQYHNTDAAALSTDGHMDTIHMGDFRALDPHWPVPIKRILAKRSADNSNDAAAWTV